MSRLVGLATLRIVTHEYDYLMPKRENNPLGYLATMFARSIHSLCYEADCAQMVDRTSLSQLYRCGTSIGANVREARYAESTRDQLHKLKIAEKELAETFYWLGLLTHQLSRLSPEKLEKVSGEATELRAILIASIKTLKARIK